MEAEKDRGGRSMIEKNNDLISRSDLIARMRQHGNRVPVDSGCREWETVYSPGVLLCIHDAEEAPAVDAEPVRHGRWFFDSGVDHCEKCTECKSPKPPHYISDNYCPNCGAKMDGDSSAKS